MKKQILTILLTATILASYAQINTTPNKVYYNEFGVDATGFIKQFFNLNQNQNSNYSPTYFLTYRRHFKSGNIRFAVGGAFDSHDITPGFSEDSNEYHSNSYSFNARIGWEFINEISKNWQVYYGLDFRPSYSYEKNDAQYWNGGYANGQESKIQNYALAPLLGFRFKLMNRISLTTETSISINWQQSSVRRYYIPVTNQYTPLPDLVRPMTKKIFSNFSQPLFIILTFDI